MARGREPVHGDNRPYGYILSNSVEDAFSLSTDLENLFVNNDVHTGRDNSWEEWSNDWGGRDALMSRDRKERIPFYHLTRYHEEHSILSLLRRSTAFNRAISSQQLSLSALAAFLPRGRYALLVPLAV